MVAAGAMAVLLLLAGYAAGWLVPRLGVPGESSPEAGFARDMSEHHGQAVEMGMIAFQKATLPDVRTLGGDIAITQQGQIGMMQTWLKSWGLGPNSADPPMAWMPDGAEALDGNRMPGMATREEIQKLRTATGKEVDILFCQYMHRHHLGGIHMVNGLLETSSNGEVRGLAETMKRGQSSEVQLLEKLLKELGAEPLR
jgi:uncharacterized protein (DUF305 family)